MLVDENGNFHSFNFFITPITTKVDKRFNILSPKSTTNAIVFNTKTASTAEHLNRLVELLIDEKADLMMVSEHCRYFTDEPGHVKYMAVCDGFTFIHLSATKNGQNATVGGVGILCSPGAAKMVRRAIKVSDRILKVDFNSSSATINHSAPPVTVISCYAPTNCANARIRETFFRTLTGASQKYHVITLLYAVVI